MSKLNLKSLFQKKWVWVGIIFLLWLILPPSTNAYIGTPPPLSTTQKIDILANFLKSYSLFVVLILSFPFFIYNSVRRLKAKKTPPRSKRIQSKWILLWTGILLLSFLFFGAGILTAFIFLLAILFFFPSKKSVRVGVLILLIMGIGLIFKDQIEITIKRVLFERELKTIIYDSYKSEEFGFTFEYPKNWRLRENKHAFPIYDAKGYTVSMDGPKGKSFYTGIDVDIYPDGDFPTFDGVINFDSIEDYADWKIAGVRSRGMEVERVETSVAGQKTIQITYSSTLAENLQLGAPLFVLKRGDLVFQEGSDIYLLQYMAESGLFDVFEKVFNHVAETFRFID